MWYSTDEKVAIKDGEDTMEKIVSAPSKPNSITPAILHDTTGAVPDTALNGGYKIETKGQSDEELGCYVTDINISAAKAVMGTKDSTIITASRAAKIFLLI